MLNTQKKFTLFLLSFFCLLVFANIANAEERIFYATDVQSSNCLTGSQSTPLNNYTLDDADLIVLKGSSFDSTEDGLSGEHTCWGGQYKGGVFIDTNNGHYSNISCFIYAGNIKNGVISWNDSEIKFYAPKSISNNVYIDNDIRLRIYDTYHSGGNNCKTVKLSLSPVCSSFTYSDWTLCSQSGTQNRTVISSSPNGCTNGNPILTQSCIPICTADNYSCSDWGSCLINNSQTRTCNKISNCEGGVEMPAISQSCTYVPPTCTSWTYSGWSECQQSGAQTRIIINSSPDNCSGGNPVLTQDCNYVPPCADSDYSCSDWSDCSQSGTQNRTCNKITNCQGGVPSPAISQSCSYVPTCIAFYYSSWSECSSDGIKTRNITSKYPSDCEGGAVPKITQSCTYVLACTSDMWSCDNWSTCSIYGSQSRTCKKTINCTGGVSAPAISQSCNYAPDCTADTWTCGSWSSCSLSGIQSRSCRKTFDCSSVETAPPTTNQHCEPPNRPTSQTPPSGTNKTVNQNLIIKSTVKLLCPVDARKASQGSGTVIDSNGTILTNKHVVAGTLGCLVGFIDDFNDEPYFGERQIADIFKVSPDNDIAILKIRNSQNKELTSVDITQGDNSLRLGAKITTYGYPAKFGTKITYTSGDFSGTDGNYLKTTAILEYGNSGGGAYLENGTFIGIPSAVVKGKLNALGYILSIDTINSWLGNSSIVYSDADNNSYSRVSVLEDIDISNLDSLKLFIPETDDKGDLSTPIATQEQPQTNQTQEKSTVIQSADSTQAQPQTNQTQKESIIIVESADTNQKINPEQTEKENGNNLSIKISEQKRSTVANAVQEIIKVAERNGEVGQQIKIIAQTQTQNQEKLETGIQKIQSRSGFAKFFIGPNYGEIKNSQKLLKQNKEQIQKLNKFRTQIVSQEDQLQIVEQIQIFEQANQQIEISLNESQKGFSLFGWIFRFFAK